ncbi:MAG: thymidine phosphorylase, partial [Aureliella sp.]
FVDGQVSDSQMAAWSMAVLLRGMSAAETSALTAAMLASGTSLPRATDRPRVDKHSTGGLGDSTSLILAPLLACFDLDVPMLSGRGLGITGGTLDKLESIPGFRCNLSEDEISRQLAAIGCVITGTTDRIAPADRQLYALRDVTGTVESIPLITASIMCKKMAETLDALVLDVKFGSGAFMQSLDQARQLAESLVSIGSAASLPTRAILSDMNQPLGRMVGNACEVNEALEVLEGATNNRLAEVTLRLCAELLVAVGKAADLASAQRALLAELASGRPVARFQQMVEHQGGRFAQRYTLAPLQVLVAAQSGRVERMHGRWLGQAIIELGGGRKQLGQAIDHAVGLEMLVRIGEQVEAGQPIVNLFAHKNSASEVARDLIVRAVEITKEAGADRRAAQTTEASAETPLMVIP